MEKISRLMSSQSVENKSRSGSNVCLFHFKKVCLQPHNFELIVRRLEVQVFSLLFFACDSADLWLFCRAQSMSHSEKCAHYFNFPLIIGLALLVNCQSQNTQFHLSFIDFSVLFVANREKMKDSKEKSISWTRYWQWSSSVSQKKKPS